MKLEEALAREAKLGGRGREGRVGGKEEWLLFWVEKTQKVVNFSFLVF